MRSTLELGLVVLSILSAFYLGASLANQPDDNINATQPLNSTNADVNATINSTINATTDIPPAAEASSNTTNVTEHDEGRFMSVFDVSAPVGVPVVHSPKRATFIIYSAVTPIRDRSKMDQSTLNGVDLKRAVEGTPHGYLTYYN